MTDLHISQNAKTKILCGRVSDPPGKVTRNDYFL